LNGQAHLVSFAFSNKFAITGCKDKDQWGKWCVQTDRLRTPEALGVFAKHLPPVTFVEILLALLFQKSLWRTRQDSNL
jgi:hypothetical protein